MNRVRILMASAVLVFVGTEPVFAQAKTTTAQEQADLKTTLDHT